MLIGQSEDQNPSQPSLVDKVQRVFVVPRVGELLHFDSLEGVMVNAVSHSFEYGTHGVGVHFTLPAEDLQKLVEYEGFTRFD